MRIVIGRYLKTFFLLTLTSLILFLGLFVLTIPKFLLLDRWLLAQGIYLTANKVEEGITYIKLSSPKVIYKDLELARLDSLELSLGFPYLYLKGKCQGGHVEIKLYPFGKVEAKGKDFNCFKGFNLKSLDLTIKEGITGKIELYDVKLRDTDVERLFIEFKGRTFDMSAKALGVELVGGGQISWNSKEILKSQINGTAVGGGVRFIIQGTLQSPSLELLR